MPLQLTLLPFAVIQESVQLFIFIVTHRCGWRLAGADEYWSLSIGLFLVELLGAHHAAKGKSTVFHNTWCEIDWADGKSTP